MAVVRGGTVVLRAIAAPPKLLYASTSLVKAEGGVCLLVGLLTGEPMIGVTLFAVLHAASVVLTRRDPFFIEVLQARIRCGKTRNIRPVRGNRYVP